MSLINRMLQDLDARAGQPGAAPLPADIKPVLPPDRGRSWKLAAIVAGTSVALVALGTLGWGVVDRKPVAPVAPVAASAPAAAPAAKPVAPAVSAPTAPVVAFEVPVAPRQDSAAPAVASVKEEAPAKPVAAPALAEKAQEAPKTPIAQAGLKPATPAAKRSMPAAVAKEAKAIKPAAPEKVAPAKAGRDETPAQRAENAYRRALAALEDGRVTEAIAGLQAALKTEPRHDAARQTLVSLLIEAKRPDEALRQLGAALALDPRQPAMAMLMARLQIERGSPGVDTLLRTLPYAAGDGEYHAFLAGALQRDGRQREAAEHYQAALRTAPHNGVWWMGLGIALQAEKRNQEAAGAFQKALDSGSLSPELQGFVERKLRQLGR